MYVFWVHLAARTISDGIVPFTGRVFFDATDIDLCRNVEHVGYGPVCSLALSRSTDST